SPTRMGTTAAGAAAPRSMAGALAERQGVSPWARSPFSVQADVLLLVGERFRGTRAGVCLSGGRLPRAVVHRDHGLDPVAGTGRGGIRGAFSPRRRLSRSQAASGNGRVSGMDQGTDSADLSSPDGGADLAAFVAVPTGLGMWRRHVVESAGVESAQETSLAVG